MTNKKLNFDYKHGYSMKDISVAKIPPGLSEKVIRQISAYKKEPKWMLYFRLSAYKIFKEKHTPTWGGDLSKINYDKITYFARATDRQMNKWEDLPDEIKTTYDRIGVPDAEKKYLAGESA